MTVPALRALGPRLPVGVLSVSTLYLTDDGRFPGTSLLVSSLQAGATLESLTPKQLEQFSADTQRAISALRIATAATRIEYAIIDDCVPQLHAHLIPRYRTDPRPTRPSWEDPRRPYPVMNDRKALIVAALSKLLPQEAGDGPLGVKAPVGTG